MNNIISSLYKFKGFSTRKQYWNFMIDLTIIFFVIGLCIGYYEISTAGWWFTVMSSCLNFILLPAMVVRRLNDCMLNPWLAILAFIPIISIPALITIGCIRSREVINVNAEIYNI